MRKKDDDRFNASVPELIAKVRASMAVFLRHAEITQPWPPFVPTPERLEAEIAYLEKASEAISSTDISTIATLQRARREVKTSVGKVVRYVEMILGSSNDRRSWPGFDLRRHPGERRTPRRAAKRMAGSQAE